MTPPDPSAGSPPEPPPRVAPEHDALDEPTLKLTPGWIAVGVSAVLLGLAMGFIMSSVWLVR